MASKIRDIALEAKVSPATVSLVLNRKPGVGLETRKRVLEIAKELNYKYLPAELAPLEKENVIRFLRIARHGHVIHINQNSIITDYIEGLEKEAKRNGYRLEISSFEHFDPEDILKSLKESPVAGIILLGTELSDDCIEAIQSTDLSAVFIDTIDENAHFDFVNVDNSSAVFSVISYLKKMGHTNIGIVTDPMENKNFRLREHSFIKGLAYHGLHFQQENFFSIASIYEKENNQLATLLQSSKQLPSALFCVADLIAYECMKTLKSLGFSIPEDISIIGFDDLPASSYVEPPLTSVRVHKQRVGQRAMQLLLQRIKDPTEPYEQVLIRTELITRESVKDLNI